MEMPFQFSYNQSEWSKQFRLHHSIREANNMPEFVRPPRKRPNAYHYSVLLLKPSSSVLQSLVFCPQLMNVHAPLYSCPLTLLKWTSVFNLWIVNRMCPILALYPKVSLHLKSQFSIGYFSDEDLFLFPSFPNIEIYFFLYKLGCN